MASNRCHRPSLHRGHGFTARKDDGGRLRLHNRPQILGREITERAALPLAVIALGEIEIDGRVRGASLAIEDELGGLLTTLKRARHHPDYGHGCGPVPGQSRLVAPDLVQADADGPTAGPASSPVALAVVRPCRTRITVAIHPPNHRLDGGVNRAGFDAATYGRRLVAGPQQPNKTGSDANWRPGYAYLQRGR